MISKSTAAVLTAALAGLGATTPVNSKIDTTDKATRHFTVDQVVNTAFKPHGFLQLAKAYDKYGIPMPKSLAETVAMYRAAYKTAKRDSGSVVATPEMDDIEYLSPVKFGTPPQTLNLDLDSGSADLWVFSTDTADYLVEGQTLYNPGKSSTSKKIDGATWSISYGDGSNSRGIVYHDVVNVGGVCSNEQVVESAQKLSSSFTVDTNFDGILGLGFGSINQVKPQRAQTFFENVAGHLDVAAWTADLKYHAPGTYDFSVINKSKHTGDIAYLDVDNSRGYWNITAEFGGQPVGGIVDTGTTLGLLPDAVLTAYYGKVQGAQLVSSIWQFPCDAKLPDFTFKVGKVSITVPGKYINYSTLDAQRKICFGGLQSSGYAPFSIFGQMLLKAAFVVFDQTKSTPRIGFATKKL